MNKAIKAVQLVPGGKEVRIRFEGLEGWLTLDTVGLVDLVQDLSGLERQLSQVTVRAQDESDMIKAMCYLNACKARHEEPTTELDPNEEGMRWHLGESLGALRYAYYQLTGVEEDPFDDSAEPPTRVIEMPDISPNLFKAQVEPNRVEPPPQPDPPPWPPMDPKGLAALCRKLDDACALIGTLGEAAINPPLFGDELKAFKTRYAKFKKDYHLP